MLSPLLGVLLMLTTNLPMGSAPPPVPFLHFPDRLHAFVWRNWTLVPTERLAEVVGAKPAEILRMGRTMGLSEPPPITKELQRRAYLTVIRRNWHLLPYEQLLPLLGWTEAQMDYTLREDDFLYVKLGSLKPRCEPIRYHLPDAAALQREAGIAHIVQQNFGKEVGGKTPDPLFHFVRQLSEKRELKTVSPPPSSRFSPRFCYSYFALYGDPLLEKDADPYPDGYLARMAAAGVNGVWLQAVLYKLAPFPWDPAISERYQERLKNLRALVTRARKYGIGVYLYLNEPRAMPLDFYKRRPEMQGVVEGDHAALCTSAPAVQKYLTEAVASICRAVPDLAGFFTITASENLTNCWSHGGGAGCPRCGKRSAAAVIAEVNGLFREGIRQASSSAQLIAWDWGWPDDAAEAIIANLPSDVALMSVSEWSLPIKRGGVESVIGEYSVSTVGPGPRALRHWELARKRGLKTLAKIQAANSWELSTVPYIPALENTAQHAANLRAAQVDGLMLGWTLGGYPSPNLEVVAEMGKAAGEKGRRGEAERGSEREGIAASSRFPISAEAEVAQALEAVAGRRFGSVLAPAVVEAWRAYSAAFREYPFHGGLVYTAPVQLGPANLLWERPTGYHATMVGFPYDDLDTWRAVYPPEVFIAQFEKVADGFEKATAQLRKAIAPDSPNARTPEHLALESEIRIAEAVALHLRSVANQARFVIARRQLADAKTAAEARAPLAELERVLDEEMALARRLYQIQIEDSRIGFEASNQYSYVPLDLVEKVLNCEDLRTRWLPAQHARFGR